MKLVHHKAATRGEANFGWLRSNHSFSFGEYFNSERIHFGALRVLNDDHVSAAKGFGTHPHKNMEIISIPLEGDLEHKDSMGNSTIIKQGDIQIMSAGTGIQHSEYNRNQDIPVKFLQIWIIPKAQNVTPRYDQISMDGLKNENTFYQVLSPNKNGQGVWIHQDSWFHLADITKETTLKYDVKKPGNGVYFFLIDGAVIIENESLEKRDGLGVWETQSISVQASEGSRILAIEVPMINLN
tara:strand:- start:21678 stop:22397 length:720 start_codon:yes stop_codon:yes gene_type:complete